MGHHNEHEHKPYKHHEHLKGHHETEKGLSNSIKGSKVNITKEISLKLDSDSAKQRIDTYDIVKVPTILLSRDVETYPGLIRAWTDVGAA